MSPTVCLSPTDTLHYPQGGGHLWVFLNWALGLRALGCEVIWLQMVSHQESTSAPKRRLRRSGLVESPDRPAREVQIEVATLKRRLERFGLAGCLALHLSEGEILHDEVAEGCMEVAEGCMELEVAAEADLLLNQRYNLPREVVGRFRRSVLVDIDPGLLQTWLSAGSIRVAPHDMYFTVGATVGQPGARFPDAGLKWHYTPPPVYLSEWRLV